MELDLKYKAVKEHHQFQLSSDISSFLEKQKQIIENEFFPAQGLPKSRLSVARKAITDSKKLGFPPQAIADLMLFYVETGVRFTNEYGDIDEPFYTSMENMYRDAMNYINKQRLQELYQNRAHAIVQDSANTGWGFHDTLADFFYF